MNSSRSPVPIETLGDALPHLVWVESASGQVLYANAAARAATGAERSSAGIHLTDWLDDRDDPAARRVAALTEGDAPAQVSLRLKLPDEPRPRLRQVHASPTVVAGDPARVFVVVDVDEVERRAVDQAFVVAATRVLGSSLDLTHTLNDVGQLVVPHLADWFAIDLVNERGDLERLAVAHVDPAKVEYAWELWRRYPPQREDPHGPYTVIAEKRTIRFEEIPDALVDALDDPEVRRIVRELGLTSSMSLPLLARGRALGVLSLVSAESGRRYDARDQEFAEDFALRIATAVDNAQLYREAVDARRAAETMAADVLEQSHAVERALTAMRAERDAALARAGEG
ncbi:MAG: GAF domain-containing protein [Polyangiales bacterium]